MVKLGGFKVGKYLQYHLVGPVYPEGCFHQGVKLVTEYDVLLSTKLGIHRHCFDWLSTGNTNLFVYFEEGTPLGMMWGHSGSCYVRGPGIPIIQDEAAVYWFWIHTVPEARGKNVFNKLRDSFFCYYAEKVAFTALVEPQNEIMRHLMSKMGFKVTSTHTYLKCGRCSVIHSLASTTPRSMEVESGNRLKLFEI